MRCNRLRGKAPHAAVLLATWAANKMQAAPAYERRLYVGRDSWAKS